MKIIVVLSTFILFLFSNYSIINASRLEQKSPNPRLENREENRQLKVNAIRRERIRSFFSKIITKIEAISERLQILIDRIQKRIDTIKEKNKNIDTKQAEINLKLAKDALETANKDIDELKELFESVIISDDPKTNFESVRTSLKKIKDNLKEARKNLVLTIGSLKGLKVGDDNNE